MYNFVMSSLGADFCQMLAPYVPITSSCPSPSIFEPASNVGLPLSNNVVFVGFLA